MKVAFVIGVGLLAVPTHCVVTPVDCVEGDLTCHPALLGARATGQTTSSVSGRLSGLVTGSTVLQNNGADVLTLNSNGVFSFATSTEIGSNYSITILTQPTDVRCFVQNRSGTFTGTTTDLIVTVPSSARCVSP